MTNLADEKAARAREAELEAVRTALDTLSAGFTQLAKAARSTLPYLAATARLLIESERAVGSRLRLPRRSARRWRR